MQKENYSDIENRVVNYNKIYYIESLYKEKILIYTLTFIIIKLINYFNLNIEFCILLIYFIDIIISYLKNMS